MFNVAHICPWCLTSKNSSENATKEKESESIGRGGGSRKCPGEGEWGHIPERSPNILVSRGCRHWEEQSGARWPAASPSPHACTLDPTSGSGSCSQRGPLGDVLSVALLHSLPICKEHRHKCNTHLCISTYALGLLNNPRIHIKGTMLEGTNRAVHRSDSSLLGISITIQLKLLQFPSMLLAALFPRLFGPQLKLLTSEARPSLGQPFGLLCLFAYNCSCGKCHTHREQRHIMNFTYLQHFALTITYSVCISSVLSIAFISLY